MKEEEQNYRKVAEETKRAEDIWRESAAEFHERLEKLEKKLGHLPKYLDRGKTLLRFYDTWGTKGVSEPLRIQIDPEANVATIGVRKDGKWDGFHVHVPNEVLDRAPVEVLYYILRKYKEGRCWKGMSP